MAVSQECHRLAFASAFVNATSFFPSSRKPHRHARVSLQEPTAETKGRTAVWVNPNSPRASRLRTQTESRFARLTQLAGTLDSAAEIGEALAAAAGDPSEQDAVTVLNHMANPRAAALALRWFRDRVESRKEAVLFNVALKVARKARDWPTAEDILNEMIAAGVAPDNVTFSTVISCARVCNLPDQAARWFERMPDFGLAPDDVTYSAMIDAYGRSGEVDKAMELYDRARADRRRLDPVTFSTVIKVYSGTGNFDGALNVYEEMKALGVKPNLITYNTLLDAMGRAARPWQVKAVYREMEGQGLAPNRATFAALLRAYARARYPEDALKVYREMKEKGMDLTVVLCNTLLAMCADLGLVEEAIEIFSLMESRDSWTYSSMITIYSCSGGVAEAEAMFEEMTAAGFEPNLFVLTSLVQCYGKARRIDAVAGTFERMVELGITPDERFCGCLLNVLAEAPEEERGKVVGCLRRASASLGEFVEELMDERVGEERVREKAEELFLRVGREVNKAYCNCLIDLSLKLGRGERACSLLDVALRLGIYAGLQAKTETQWSLNVRSLSLGAARTALRLWMGDLRKTVEGGEELPPLLGINTGHGKHRYSDKGLAAAFETELRRLSAPFHEAPDKVGWFLTTRVAAKAWLESLNVPA